jgi:Carboxypeptidase regulatory-like domain/TonB dependent receptor
MAKQLSIAAMLTICICLVTLTAQPVWGQAVYGSILGTVTDPQGAAVANAKVTVLDQSKGTSDTTTTNESGNYSVTHLIPDVYTVRVEAPGFKVSEQKDVTVSVDTGSRVDLQFQVGGTSETVEVTGEASQLKTDRADVSTTFDTRMVEALPLLNRNFTSLELAAPGTQKLVGWSHAATENPQGSQQIFVNGQHFSGTAYELDGTDNQDPILGIIVVNPNIDAITETKFALQNYDAEFGKAVAGVVTVQTKSGSNEFHGGGFWFRRTDATQARDPFTNSAPDSLTGRFLPSSRWQQFGGTIGGPIIKNKLFFFGDYQGTRQSSGITNQLSIPTAQVISTCTGAGDGSGFCKLDQYVPFFGNGKAGDPTTLLYDPNTGDQIAGTGRLAFCGPAGCATQPDWLPMTAAAAASVGHPAKSIVSPVAQNILGQFPKQSNGDVTNNFVKSGAGPFVANSFDTRVDYTASSTVNLFGRFSLARFKLSGTGSLGPLGGVGLGLNGLAGSSVTHNFSLATGFTKTFSSTLLTDFRFGWFKYNPTTHKPDEGKTPAKDAGIPNVNMGDLFTSGWPSFQGDGGNGKPGVWSGFGDGLNVGRCNCPLIESEQQIQFVNNWTKIKGNHLFKFGADVRRAYNLRVPSDADRAGVMNLDSGVTSDAGVGGNGIGTFLLGFVHNMNRFVSTSLSAAERQNRLFFYGQDTYRITPKLTLSYGLRWEIYFPESVNAKGNGGFANPQEGIIRIAGYGKYGLNGNIDNNWKAFAPRLGIAYQVTPKTVVRLGYGRSYDIGVFGSNFGHAVTQNLPVLANQGVSASNNTVNNGYTCNPPPGPCVVDAYFPAFTLDQGPPIFSFPPIPSDGILPLGGPNGNVQPRMRPTRQRLPTLDAWNATVQRQVTNTISLEVAYVGSKGTNGFAGNGPAYNLNQVPFGPGTAVVTVAGQTPNFTANVPRDQRRPFYNKFDIKGVVCCNNDVVMGNYFGNDANSNYNALQVKLDKRFSRGLQLMSFYTFSHANNYTNDNNFLYSVARRQSYGPDDMNRNHVWVTNVVYELPFGKGKMFAGNAGRALDLAIGGWQITSTTNWSGGLPWTANAGECGFVNDTGPCLPNIKGSFHVGAAGSFTHPVDINGKPNGQPYVQYFTPVAGLAFNPADLTVGTDTCTLARPTSPPFSLPACGSDGNVGRNTFRGPRHFSDDMSIVKNFSFTERFKAEFRMDAFNVFNHPVYGFSSQDYGATGGTCIDCGGNSGQIRDIENGTTMRQLQFAIKLSF